MENSLRKKETRKSKLLGSPMKYKGGRFDKARYQAREDCHVAENDRDLYEVDREAMQRANWNRNYSKFNIDEILASHDFLLERDLQKPEWIALYHYDDIQLDHHSLKEWSQKLPSPARVSFLTPGCVQSGRLAQLPALYGIRVQFR